MMGTTKSISKKLPAFRSGVFALGDALFLVLVSMVTTMAMFRLHHFHWNFGVTVIIGTILAMLLQVAMACLVAPILGSIESMIPSMLVAMISPMTVCAMHFGQYLSWSSCLKLSVALGITIFVMVKLQGFLFKQSLTRLGMMKVGLDG